MNAQTSSYRWKITADLIDGTDVGVEGPANMHPAIDCNPLVFEMFDDDGELYYRGMIWGEYDGFEPLDDFGAPNAGCTSIKVGGVQV